MKNFKVMSQTVLLLTIVLIFAACSANNSPNNSNEETGQTEASDLQKPDAAVERPHIPEGTGYGGYEFTVLRPKSYIGEHFDDEVYAEQENGEPLNDAIYKRNMTVENLLNIKIRSLTADADTLQVAGYAKKIIQAGSDEFDAVVGANWTHISLVQAGCLRNLYNIPNLNISKPWWDQRAIAEMSYLKSKLYYISGDIMYYDKYGIGIVYFNKRLFGESGLEYPYNKVKNGTWTISEFSKLIRDFSRDLNGDGKMDENDQWGMLENTGAVYHFLIGCGEKTVTLDNEGIPFINTITERHVEVVSALCDLFSDKNITLLAGSSQLRHIPNPYNDGIFKVFKEGRGLMFFEMIGTIPTFRDMEDDFGLLPLPKFDENQKQYHSFTSYGWATSYSIPVTNSELERTGMILEVMAGYSGDTIIPALIDISLKSKFARDEESAEMLQIIFDTKTYDLGVDYSWGGLYDVYGEAAQNGFTKFVSSMEKQIPKAEKDMAKVIELFDELD
ncbi:MAG: hypothetical protein FWD23_16050 [Oscillospiraceae bacterium]|nr:hypothetical protein [Oscillospiraceae bacterium]